MREGHFIDRLDEIKARNLPAVTAEHIVKITPKDPDDPQMVADCENAINKLDAYLSAFALVPDHRCPGCNASLGGIFGTFRWGIANGEGECSQCGYPCRGLHRPKDGMIKFFEALLPYHPDGLTRVENVAASELGGGA
jgi:hypothetical protein